MHTHIYIYSYFHYTWLACKTDISEEVSNYRFDVISWLFVALDHTYINFRPLMPFVYATCNKKNGHKSRCSELISGTKALQSNVISWLFVVKLHPINQTVTYCDALNSYLTHRLIPDHSFHCIQTTSSKPNGHKLRCSELISCTKAHRPRFFNPLHSNYIQ